MGASKTAWASVDVGLAQSGTDWGPWLLWIGVILAALLVAAWAVLLIRRRLFDAPQETRPAFSLEQLRTMHERGELSGAEYAALREKLARECREATK